MPGAPKTVIIACTDAAVSMEVNKFLPKGAIAACKRSDGQTQEKPMYLTLQKGVARGVSSGA